MKKRAELINYDFHSSPSRLSVPVKGPSSAPDFDYFKNEYQRIERKREFKRKYDYSLGNIVSTGGLVIFTLSAAVLTLSTVGSVLRPLLSSGGATVTPIIEIPFNPYGAVTAVALVLGLVFMLVGVLAIPSVAPPSLTGEEKWFLELFPALEKLHFFKADNIELARLQATQHVKRVAEMIRRTIPTLVESAMLKTELVEPLKSLTDDLDNRLVPALTSEDSAIFSKGTESLNSLAKYLLEPTLASCKVLATGLNDIPVKKVSPKIHPKLRRYILRGFVVAALPIVTFGVGIEVGVSVDTAYLSAATVFGLVVVGVIAEPLVTHK